MADASREGHHDDSSIIRHDHVQPDSMASQQLLSAVENPQLDSFLPSQLPFLLHAAAEKRRADRLFVRNSPMSRPLNVGAANNSDPTSHDDRYDNTPSYQHIRMLGHGGSASVEMVRDINTGSVYARKIIRNVYARNMDKAKQQLLNEVQIMQRLASHHHIVKVHATYIKRRELAIILDPVADGGDLANFLQNYRDEGFSWRCDNGRNHLHSCENVIQNGILRKAFGCLAAALAFIHKQAIRHKDIKPQNILIHQGRVMYTDFGLSYDFGNTGRSTTTGNPQGITRRYCAPEVANWESRNTKSDVFSLGCVFIEICLALAASPFYDHIYERPFQEVVESYPQCLPLPSVSEEYP